MQALHEVRDADHVDLGFEHQAGHVGHGAVRLLDGLEYGLKHRIAPAEDVGRGHVGVGMLGAGEDNQARWVDLQLAIRQAVGLGLAEALRLGVLLDLGRR
ncbi:hypothetical protein D3C79_893460 [compost metagenome]